MEMKKLRTRSAEEIPIMATNWKKAASAVFLAAVLAGIAVPIAQAQDPAVDPAAVQILQRMTDYMAGLQHFSVHSDNTLEDQLESGQKMMYQSMKGARNAGTHGVLAAPTVTGRQFNLWGAAAITTKGQMILADTLAHLNEKHIRVVYGDTDGIYMGCSRSMGNIPEFSKSIGNMLTSKEDTWITKPEVANAAIKQSNEKWQRELKYPDFELEAEQHDAMIFVKHKNYLIFDTKNGKVEMTTKGNNFKGSDKANIARKVLEDIMLAVLREDPGWTTEEDARAAVKAAIKRQPCSVHCRDVAA